MKLVRCNGEPRHYYDAEEYSECPECKRLAQHGAAVPQAQLAVKERSRQGTLSLEEINRQLASTGANVQEPSAGAATLMQNDPTTVSDTSREGVTVAPNISAKLGLLQKLFGRREKEAAEEAARTLPAEREPFVPAAPAAAAVQAVQNAQEEVTVFAEETAMIPPVPHEMPVSPAEPAVSPRAEQTSLASAVAAVQRTHQPNAGKTVAYYNIGGSEPVVGWLVCVKGTYQGESFVLKTGQNFIGRSLSMDVILKDEMTVSRENHAMILFEPQRQVFYLMAGQSTGITYLNDAPVLMPAELKAYDKIGVGNALLVFIPFCGAQFRWEDYIEKDDAG